MSPAQLERKTIELDWNEAPLTCPEREDLPASDPRSLESVTETAHERVLEAIEAELAAGWALDGTAAEAITLERRKRQILLPTPGVAGPRWEEYCAAEVRLRRG